MRRFEVVEGGSGKFWEIQQQGSDVTVRFGKLGTTGQVKTKAHPSVEAATKDHDALVREKTKKGYVEVSGAPTVASASATHSKAPSELEALAAHGDEILARFGELTLLPPGETSGMADHFVAGADGALWQEVFASIEWIADEAHGGAVGFWNVGSRRAVVHVDSEGQFRLTGNSLLDHFASMLSDRRDDFAEEAGPMLREFVAAQKLPPLRSDAQRAADLKGMESPQARFDALKSGAKAKPKAAPTKKGAALPPLGPRPLCTSMVTAVLSSGKLLVLAGEDTNAEPIDYMLGGRTYLFDLTTLASEEAAPMKPPDNFPAHLVPLSGDRALLLKPWSVYDKGAWSPAPGEPIRELSMHSKVHALADGSFIALSSANDVLAHRILADGSVQRLGDRPERRAYDGMVTLTDGRLWFGGGEVNSRTTRSTVILDPESWTFSAGPDLPDGHFHRGAFFGAAGRAMVLGRFGADIGWSVWDGSSWGAPQVSPELARGVSDFHVLADGTVVSVRWTDGAIVTFAPSTFEMKIAGHIQLGQSGARAHELTDGRVLFIGGTLYGNVPAEPEVWDRASGLCVPLQGREKDAQRQAKALLKYREKQAAEDARTRALLAAQAAARAAKQS